MVACLFAVALLAFVVHQAHGTPPRPRCFLMVSSINVNKVFAPYHHYWREISNNGYGPEDIVTTLEITSPRGRVRTRASYNETRGCIVGGYGHTAEDDKLDGALTRKPNSEKIEWPKGYVIPVDAPIQPPFLGKLTGAVSSDTKTSGDFADCYKFGLEKKANGIQWHYKTDQCIAYFGAGTRPTGVVSAINNLADSSSDHYRSLLYQPITFHSTPEERIYFGTDNYGVRECVQQAKKKNLEAKFVSWNRSSRWCFRSTKGGLIPTFDNINNIWETVKVDLAGPPKLDSSTFKCKPKA